MKKILVLGAGMVGKAIAIDLSKKHYVTSVDINEEALYRLSKEQPQIKTILADVANSAELTKLLKDFDLIISAVPGFLGFAVLKTIINAGKDVVDISFMPEDALQLHDLAVQNNVTAITDCGVAPGIPNFIVGYHNETMKIDNFEYMVGGLPKVRNFPFEYKAPFSPVDVLEEYTRPARYLENGHIIVKPPMSDPEYVNFKQVGDLEAFNTDGLRSLLYTMSNIQSMKEKTLRYPGHIHIIKALTASGFFSTDSIEIAGKSMRPFDFTSKILFKEWKLNPDEPEFTVMLIKITGEQDGVATEIMYELYDEFDVASQTSSMARTTGYTATATAQLFLSGGFTQKGLYPPELVGKDATCFEFIMQYLKDRNIIYYKSERNL